MAFHVEEAVLALWDSVLLGLRDACVRGLVLSLAKAHCMQRFDSLMKCEESVVRQRRGEV